MSSSTENFYLLTIKNNSFKYTSRKEISEVLRETIQKSKKMGYSSFRCFELDTLDRWHMHTYCTSSKPIYKKKFLKEGWSIHFQPFPQSDMKKIFTYINKTPQDWDHQNQLDIRSFSKYNYMFQ